MNVHWISRETKVTTDITPLIVSVDLNGEYRSACRTIDLEIVASVWDTTIPELDLKLGDNIGVRQDNNLLFYGVVWSITKSTTGSSNKIHCKDFGIYLLKNRYSYKFQNMTPEAITKKICSDYGIEVGSIVSVGKNISRNFMGTSLYDMIMTSYNLSDSGEYMIRFSGKALNVVKKGETTVEKQIEKWSNLLTADATESLDEMVNTIYIRDEEDKNLIDTLENKEDRKKYGLLSDTYRKDKDEDYHKKANKNLKGIEYKLEVTNFGDINFITGNAVIVTEHWTKLFGKFYIDSDNHTWKDGLYTNRLVLNYKNLADENEAGSEIEEEKKKI